MKKSLIGALVLALGISGILVNPVKATAAKQRYTCAWSHYTGWEFFGYMQQYGILKKHADRYGIRVDFVLVPDYIPSVEQYAAGQHQCLAVTNMDALMIPAANGVDTTALVVGDFSNGNDGAVLKNGKTLKDLAGRKVRLEMGSVSQFLLYRALQKNGMSPKQVTLVNTAFSDIGTAFAGDKDPKAALVTWNPTLMEVRLLPNTTMVFDSSQIPGEIIDMLVVRTDAPASLKKAITAAWYETMEVMKDKGNKRKEAVGFMAKNAGGTIAQFEAQLKTTAMFYNAREAVAFTRSGEIKKTMDYVRTFVFENGLFGKGVSSKDHVGISFPDGSVLGRKDNVKLRFDATYMQLAAEGKL